jgi:DNA-binding response OmpR family regulator
MSKTHIAVIEDEHEVAQGIATWLRQLGADVEVFTSGVAFLTRVDTVAFDLVVCDWVMPEIEGVDLVRQLRELKRQTMPVLMLTSRTTERDIVEGLTAGADDYLLKPVAKAVFQAKANALLRRQVWLTKPTAVGGVEIFGDYVFEPLGTMVRVRGEAVTLTLKEFELARILFRTPEKVFSRVELAKQVWPMNAVAADTRTINVHVHNVRRKLGLNTPGAPRIRQVYGVGYVLTRDSSGDDTEESEPVLHSPPGERRIAA